MMWLPDPKEIIKLKRQFILNVLNEVIGEDFRSWIDQCITERNKRMLIEKQ
jgi:hypothetical protein